MKFPEREHILSPWLTTQGLAMIYAERGIGKTHISLGIAYAVASGGEFLKWKAPKARGVLFIDGEMQGNVLQERFKAIMNSSDNPPSAPLEIITPDIQEFGIPDLSTEEGQSKVNQFITEDIELIIVDNLSTCARSGRENEAESWLPVQNWALQLRAAGKAVLFIHHSGKEGQQRGTSRREDVLDTVLNLKKPPFYNPEDGANFEVHFKKNRSLHGNDVKAFQAHLQTDDNEVQSWEISSLDDDKDEQIVSLINQGLNQSAIAKKLGIDKSTVSRRIKNQDSPTVARCSP